MNSAYISLIIGSRGLVYEANLYEIIGWESSDMVRFEDPMRIAKFIIGPRDLQCETNVQESWARNLLMWSDLTLGLSFKVLQGFKSAYNLLIIGSIGLQSEANQ